MVAFLIGFVVGGILFGGLVWILMSLAIAAPAFEQIESEDFLSEPVELERRSLVRWKGLKVMR